MKNVISKKKIFDGRLLRLYRERRRFPSGYIGDIEIIEHPVLVVPFLDEGTIILIRQYRPVISSYIWELPAGTLNKGELPLTCARREIKEEIGYEAKYWKKIGCIYPAPGYTTEKIILFEARGLKKIEHKKEEDEIITPHILTRKKILGLLQSGKIIDAKTIAALALANIL